MLLVSTEELCVADELANVAEDTPLDEAALV